MGLVDQITYQTSKIVVIIDRKIGLFYYVLCLLIIAYVALYVLLYKKEYSIF